MLQPRDWQNPILEAEDACARKAALGCLVERLDNAAPDLRSNPTYDGVNRHTVDGGNLAPPAE